MNKIWLEEFNEEIFIQDKIDSAWQAIVEHNRKRRKLWDTYIEALQAMRDLKGEE